MPPEPVLNEQTLLEQSAQQAAEDIVNSLADAKAEFFERVIKRFFPPAVYEALESIKNEEELELAKKLYEELGLQRLEGPLENKKGICYALTTTVPWYQGPLRFAEAEFEIVDSCIQIKAGMLKLEEHPLWPDDYPAFRNFVLRLARLRFRAARQLSSEGSSN